MISEVELRQKDSQPLSLLSLPDEIIENILARIPKWSHPNVSLVSKRFLTFLSSPELYTTRSNIGTTEACLYFCLESYNNHTCPQWFTLSMKPNEIITGNDGEVLNEYSLIRLPSSSSHSLSVLPDSTVAVGSDIYLIGVLGRKSKSSSSVQILDCRSHTWRDAPNMTVARSDPMAVYLDEKIYVMDGDDIDESSNSFEVFDIKTQIWRTLPCPYHELGIVVLANPDALEGKLYVAAETNDYTYEPKDGTWKVAREESSYIHLFLSCVIENVMCCCEWGHLKWYDSEAKVWREIKGLEWFVLHTRGSNRNIIRVVNYGGKLVVLWRERPDQKSKHKKNKKNKIWCAKIALEKHHRGEIWGKKEWLNTVLEFPESYYYCKTCVPVFI